MFHKADVRCVPRFRREVPLAAAELSEPGLIASDLPRYLGRAWLKMQADAGR